MAIIVDTGVLVAAIDGGDPNHKTAKRFLENSREPFVVPSAVLPEVCYLAQKYIGPKAELDLLEGLVAGEMTLDWAGTADLAKALQLLRRRPDLGLVDTMVIATAERLRIKKIATFDRRHFGSLTTEKGEPFELLP